MGSFGGGFNVFDYSIITIYHNSIQAAENNEMSKDIKLY